MEQQDSMRLQNVWKNQREGHTIGDAALDVSKGIKCNKLEHEKNKLQIIIVGEHTRLNIMPGK